MSDIEVLHLDHPKVYARWTVMIGGGKSPIKWARKPPITGKSTAKLSHIASGERLRVLNVAPNSKDLPNTSHSLTLPRWDAGGFFCRISIPTFWKFCASNFLFLSFSMTLPLVVVFSSPALLSSIYSPLYF